MKKYNVEIFFTDEENSKFLEYLDIFNQHVNSNNTPDNFIKNMFSVLGGNAKSFLNGFEFLIENSKNLKGQ